MPTPNADLNINQDALINTPVSEKGMAPTHQVYNFISDKNPNINIENTLLDGIRPNWLKNMSGLPVFVDMKPSDVMNARAGDPNYTNKAFAEVEDYLKNNKEYHREGPDNINESAWSTEEREDPRLPINNNNNNNNRDDLNRYYWNMAYNRQYQTNSQIGYGGAYVSNKDSTMVYNPNYYRRSANRQVPVYFLTEPARRGGLAGSMYIASGDGRSLVISADDHKIVEDMKKSPDFRFTSLVPGLDAINPDFSGVGSPGDLVFLNHASLYGPMGRYGSITHELNHAYQLPSCYSQSIIRVPDNSIHPKQREAARYGLNEHELMQGAAAFQQQHYRNTGSRVKRPEDFESELQKAMDNVQDYDSESRRFLDYVRYLKNLHPDVYNEVKNKMPLIVRNGRIPGYDTKYKNKVVG